MSRPRNPLRASPAVLVLLLPACANAGTAAEYSAQQLAAANRLSWGITRSALDGTGDGAALTPDSALPPAAAAQIAAMRISKTPMAQLAARMDAQSRAANALTDPPQRQAAQVAYQRAMSDLAREAATRSILRDLYSPAQLREQMTWFWFNHFNVAAQKRDIRAMVGDYEDTIRAHAMGKFRDLLEATLRHPAMLRYLDNDQNAAGHINENYAREIMELHALGVGSGYSQKDVQELARVLTGVGVELKPDAPALKPEWRRLYLRDGLFVFDPARHDFDDKQFLGHTIKGAGFAEVEQALGLITASPATARHVSERMATYFMGEAPPPALVARMTAAWTRSDGDIATVLDAMFHAPEYQASLGKGFKDPMHYVISAVRYAYDGQVILNADPIINWLRRAGQDLYAHQTPDGYPIIASAWVGPGQMETRFEIAKAIGNGSAGLFKPHGADVATQSSLPQLRNALWSGDLSQTVAPQTQAALAQATSQQEWNMLFLASPDFMRR